MKSYTTIMYAKNLPKDEFWLGVLDASGKITHFTDFILEQPMPRLLKADNMFYYVKVDDDNGKLDVCVAQWYMAMTKEEPSGRSIADMVRNGHLNPIESANKILEIMHGTRKH